MLTLDIARINCIITATNYIMPLESIAFNETISYAYVQHKSNVQQCCWKIV